jgi:hypothetical protein
VTPRERKDNYPETTYGNDLSALAQDVESGAIFDGIHTWLATARTRVSGIFGMMDIIPEAPVQSSISP